MRFFAPLFVDSEAEAEASRQEMIETLWHMADHDLAVEITRVDREEAEREERQLAAEAGPARVWISPDFRRPD